MSDKKKVVWINWALEEEAKYQVSESYIHHHYFYVTSVLYGITKFVYVIFLTLSRRTKVIQMKTRKII